MNGYDLLMRCQRLEDSRLSLADKAVLCGIASFFNEQKGCAFPSLKQLQSRACCGDRHTVIRAIRRLVDFGLLSVTQRKGAGNEYRALLGSVETNTSVESNTGVETNTGGSVESNTRGGVESNTQNTNRNTKRKTKSTSASADVPPQLALSGETTLKKSPERKTLDFYGLPDDLISEWRQFRKLKKAPLTQRVIDAHLREARDARLSLQQAVEYAMNVGWTAFSSNFYRNREKKVEEKYDPFDVRNLNKPSPSPFHIKTNDAEEDAAFAEFMSK